MPYNFHPQYCTIFTSFKHIIMKITPTMLARPAIVLAMFLASVFTTHAQTAVACTGVDASGDFSYAVYTHNDTVHFTFFPLAPIVGSSSAIIYIKKGTGQGAYPGYNMVDSSGNFVFSLPVPAATTVSFYFTYNVPAGGERNSSANPVQYVSGTVCYAGAPTVAITTPADAASYTAPASVAITATASDASGISSVAFYHADTLLGTASTAPYSFTWANVPAGHYSLTAKATNNNSISTVSIPVGITVNKPNTDGFCGTSVNGDYEYKATTVGGKVTFTFHPLAPIAGCAYSLIYIRQGSQGGYGGYGMAAAGSDFVFTTNTIADGVAISFYFTYNVPAGGERNSSANPQGYVVGTNCTGIADAPPTISITSPTNNASFTEPATINITADASSASSTVTSVVFYSGADSIGTSTTAPYQYSWAKVPAGNYTIGAKAIAADSLSATSTFVNVVVNIDNSMGFCATSSDSDFSYRAETVNGNVVITFHPLANIAGCAYALGYVRQGGTGPYPGYPMTKVGNDFRLVQAIPNGTQLSIYFTYQVPAGGERNSSANPQSYTVGTVCQGIALPVQLLSYTAQLQKSGRVTLAWSTGTETNNRYFLVQKSTDGRAYATLANVPAGDALAAVHQYAAEDSHPATGTNYYRLVQVDKNGNAKAYGIKTITLQNNATGLAVYPNPVNSATIAVKWAVAAPAKRVVRLQGMDGKLLYSGTAAPLTTSLQILLPAKPAAGLYLLTLDGEAPVKVVVE